MILAVDVWYGEAQAVAAGILFRGWEDVEPVRELTARVPAEAPYEPANFWKRELPPILALLQTLDEVPETIVVDGHVYLDASERAGLGRRLYDALQGRAAVVGVAKRRYKDTPVEAEVFRGGSMRPLYVTAVGMDEAEARRAVIRMHGKHRIPAMLRRADWLSRTHAAG